MRTDLDHSVAQLSYFIFPYYSVSALARGQREGGMKVDAVARVG